MGSNRLDRKENKTCVAGLRNIVLELEFRRF
jgi:hypothetical protein